MTIFKRTRGVELGVTENNSSNIKHRKNEKSFPNIFYASKIIIKFSGGRHFINHNIPRCTVMIKFPPANVPADKTKHRAAKNDEIAPKQTQTCVKQIKSVGEQSPLAGSGSTVLGLVVKFYVSSHLLAEICEELFKFSWT